MSRRRWSGWARRAALLVPAFAASLQLAAHADAFAPAAIFDASLNAVPSAVAYPAAFVAAFRTGAAISVINQPRMPSIDTEVGSQVIRLPSGARVRLFFPANCTDASSTMAPYCTDGRQTTDGMAGMVGFRQLGLSFLLGHLAEASSGCIQDAPMIFTDTESDLPLLIYSHGYGGNMDMATYFFRTMASKGMVVAAVEHTDGTASSTVSEDGSEKRFNEYYMTGRQQLTRRASELLAAADFLPKELKNIHNATIGTIMLGGHSYGAPSAIMAANGASKPSNIRGVIVHDPALGMGYGMLPPNGAKSRTPTISYVSDEYNRARVRYGDATLHVRGAFHGNFVDAPLWAPALVMRPLSALIPAAGPADPVAVHEQLAESAMAFLKSRDPLRDSVMSGDLFERVQ
ncbi:hypothetical protein ACHAXT_009247 [Thalassiosira profunda]